MPENLFISDLHLSAERPAITRLFLRFLRERVAVGDNLYILGDLFDAWVGDDDNRSPIPEIFAAMRQLSDAGSRLYFMSGNRDFLVGKRFAEATGCQLLPETQLLPLAGSPALLMHGDQLCSDDCEYQKWRKQLRSAVFINDFLAKPIAERIAIATEYRKLSGEATSLKPADIIDANQATVENMMRTAGVLLLIHGHTHRPANHKFDLDGAAASRLVLPEWRDLAGGYLYERGGLITRHVFV